MTQFPTSQALLAHAKLRSGWQKLTPLQQERAEALFLAAETPALHIIAVNNHQMRERLGLTSGQAQRLVRAFKRARLLDVSRRWETLPNGRHREKGAAAWVYTETDTLLPSQLPKRRAKRTEAALRSLQSQVDVLADEVKRVAAIVDGFAAARGEISGG
jgi:hypothetical protein